MWAEDALIYHIYPLGAVGAPATNDGWSGPVDRLSALTAQLDRLVDLGVTAVLLGPVFQASSHGYDTVDYFTVDRRLGRAADLEIFAKELAARGMRLIVDAVCNHVGRDFWAFRDVLAKGWDSPYVGWFHLDFSRGNHRGDGFTYQDWAGHDDLVKLNLAHPGVREHLFAAVTEWITRFDVSGLRLDAADVMDQGFLVDLAAHARRVRPDVWLFGEMVGGDYGRLARPGLLDAVTNYEIYKGLWSSHRDHNFFEIAHSLNRQFGPGGIYRGRHLYNFADNHDVDRVAASVAHPAQLYPLYGLLFTIPGVPSLYYGSEWGASARRTPWSDRELRPAWADIPITEPELPTAIARLARVRRDLPALRHGDYHQLHVAPEQLTFRRATAAQRVTVMVNGSESWAHVPVGAEGAGYDVLNGEWVAPSGGRIAVPPRWLRVIR